MSASRLPTTHKYSEFLREGFQSIGQFMIAPWKWACAEFNNPCCNIETESDSSDAIDCCAAGCVVCGAVYATACCCVRSPVAIVGSAVTIPVGGTAAVVLSVIGCVGMPISLSIDAATVCSQSNQQNNAKGPQVFELPNIEHETRKTMTPR